MNQGPIYVGARGHVSPEPPSSDSLVAAQIQKLADRSHVISEVPKCSKMQIFQGSTPDPTEGACSAPPDPLTDGELGSQLPSQDPPPL